MMPLSRLTRLRTMRVIGSVPERPTALIALLPHAGGAAHQYIPWRASVPPAAAAIAVEYPGHGSRIRDALPRSVDEIARALADEFEDQTLPLVLVGHSFGALVAYETAWQLSRRGHPVHGLFLSAACAPRRRRSGAVALLTDRQLVDALLSYGGLSAELVADPEALAVYLPIVRADLELADAYASEERSWEPVACSAVVAGGADDPQVPPAELSYWSSAITGPIVVKVLPGGHFYHRENREAVAQLLALLVPVQSKAQ